MKKALQKWFKAQGYESSYSGHTRTLYVHGMSQMEIDNYGIVVDFKIQAD